MAADAINMSPPYTAMHAHDRSPRRRAAPRREGRGGERPNAVLVAPGERHWDIFTSLCLGAGARGNLVPDAY